MGRPKRLKKQKNCSGVSTYPFYRKGFNESKKLFQGD